MASSRSMPPPPLSIPSNGPTTSYDIDFKHIVMNMKLLYLRRQYKQCANYCVEQITDHGSKLHPLYQTFLNFFAGLAYDALARSMSSRSPLLPSTLDDAERFFLQAKQVLPSATLRYESKALSPIDENEDELDDNSPRNSLNSQFSTTAPSTAATSVSGYHDSSDSSSCESSPVKLPMPSPVAPLFVRKRTPTRAHMDSTQLFSLPSNTLFNAAPHSIPSPDTFNSLILPSPDRRDDVFVEPDHTGIYNEALTSFKAMIANHIASVQSFRALSETLLQEIRRPVSRDESGVREMGPEEKMERIVKGRERKWQRERFDPGRYRDLCEVALAEL